MDSMANSRYWNCVDINPARIRKVGQTFMNKYELNFGRIECLLTVKI